MKRTAKQIVTLLVCMGVFLFSCVDDLSVAPFPDRDGDLIADEFDKCPDVPGLTRLSGCPNLLDGDNIWTESPEGQYAVTIFYFRPSDFQGEDEMVVAARRNNISAMLLFMQDWYGVQMEVQGFGNKTFGLLKNQHGAVNVIQVDGRETSAYYKNNQAQVRTECNEFLATVPQFKLSDHYLIFGDENSNIGFFGSGTWAVTTSGDYSMSDIEGKFYNGLQLQMSGDKFSGMLHEVGHGFGLPHNATAASVLPDVTLMGGLNSRYGRDNADTPEHVILSKSDCAILNTRSIFNRRDDGVDYYSSNPQVNLKTISIIKDDATRKIKFVGTFTSDVNITHTNIGFDFVNAGAVHPNDNYDEIIYTVEPSKVDNITYNFNVEVAYEDLFNGFQTGNKGEAEIEISVTSKNGFRPKILDGHMYTTDTSTKVPNDDILLEIN